MVYTTLHFDLESTSARTAVSRKHEFKYRTRSLKPDQAHGRLQPCHRRMTQQTAPPSATLSPQCRMVRLLIAWMGRLLVLTPASLASRTWANAVWIVRNCLGDICAHPKIPADSWRCHAQAEFFLSLLQLHTDPTEYKRACERKSLPTSISSSSSCDKRQQGHHFHREAREGAQALGEAVEVSKQPQSKY